MTRTSRTRIMSLIRRSLAMSAAPSTNEPPSDPDAWPTPMRKRRPILHRFPRGGQRTDSALRRGSPGPTVDQLLGALDQEGRALPFEEVERGARRLDRLGIVAALVKHMGEVIESQTVSHEKVGLGHDSHTLPG